MIGTPGAGRVGAWRWVVAIVIGGLLVWTGAAATATGRDASRDSRLHRALVDAQRAQSARQAELTTLQGQIQAMQSQLSALQAASSSSSDTIDELTAQIAKLQATVAPKTSSGPSTPTVVHPPVHPIPLLICIEWFYPPYGVPYCIKWKWKWVYSP